MREEYLATKDLQRWAEADCVTGCNSRQVAFCEGQSEWPGQVIYTGLKVPYIPNISATQVFKLMAEAAENGGASGKPVYVANVTAEDIANFQDLLETAVCRWLPGVNEPPVFYTVTDINYHLAADADDEEQSGG